VLVFAIDRTRLLRDLTDILVDCPVTGGPPLLLALCVSLIFRLTTETEVPKRLLNIDHVQKAGNTNFEKCLTQKL